MAKNKEKKPKKLVEGFNVHKFIIKIVAAVMLVAFGIVLWVRTDEAIFAILLITGGIAALASIFRLAMLLKSGKSKEAKIITACEGGINLVLGAYLIISAFVYLDDPTSKFSDFNNKYYLYFLSAILYVKSVGYFWECVLHKSETTKFIFWLHIGFITVSVLFAALADKATVEQIVWGLIILAFLCSLVIGGEAGGGYYKYRKTVSPKKEKEKKKEEKPEIEAPASDEEKIIDEIDPSIIPVEDIDGDSTIVS